MDAVPNLSYAVSHYASHRLHSNVQFSAIENIMQSMKTNPSIIYMVTYHKQKSLQMIYREWQADYYGKKNDFLVIMETRWKVYGKFSVFEY